MKLFLKCLLLSSVRSLNKIVLLTGIFIFKIVGICVVKAVGYFETDLLFR